MGDLFVCVDFKSFFVCGNRAVTLGSISSALVAFGRKEDEAGIYTVSTEAQIMAGCLVTTACSFALYASERHYQS